MKNLKELIREFLFECLVSLIFKVAKNYTLIKFEKEKKGSKSNYNFIVRVNIEGKEKVVPYIEEYLRTISVKMNS